MSSSKKKGRLALKKRSDHTEKKDGKSTPQATILSMFKKQHDKEKDKVGKAVDQESESGEVIITGVTSRETEDVLEDVNLVPCESAGNVPVKRKTSETSSRKGRLRLSKRLKLEDSSDQTFDLDKACDSGGEVNEKSQTIDYPTPYKLRVRKTVPVIEIASESDTDNDEDVNTSTVVLDFENSRNDIVSSGNSDFQEAPKHRRGQKRKTTLKKSSTDSEVYDMKAKRKVSEKIKMKPRRSSEKDSTSPMKEILTKEKKTSKKHAKNNSKSEESLISKHEEQYGSMEKLSSPDPKGKNSKQTISVSNTRSKTSTSESGKGPVTNPGSKDDRLQRKEESKEDCVQESRDDVRIIEIKDSLSKNFKQGTLKHLFMKKTTNTKKQTNHGLTGKTKIKDSSVRIHDSDDLKGSSETAGHVKEYEHDEENRNKNNSTLGIKKNKSENSKQKPSSSGALADENLESEDTKEKHEVIYKVPYYLENFRTILGSVLDDSENARLFSEADMAHVTMFNQLTEPAQKLYIRMFSRKLAWLPMSKLKYPDISDNIPKLVDELYTAKFLHLGDKLESLKTVLQILSSPDLKTLAKSFHISNIGTKDKLTELLLKKSQQSSIGSLFVGGSGASTEKIMLQRALSYLGKVCHLEESARAVFIRILMLFSLYHTNFDEDSAGGGQNQLFQMLMANIGRVVYPTYTVEKKRPVFQDRAALVRFETALQFELELQIEIDKGRWTQAYEVYEKARNVGMDLKNDSAIHKWDVSLPLFLRLYSARSVYTRIDSLGVEILQRLKRYREAVTLLEELLTQDMYCVHHRGHWYERLGLNLDAHLKNQEKSLEMIKRGLSDDRVHSGRRLALYERAKKICDAPKSKFAKRISEFKHDPVSPTPEVCIDGMVISDAGSMGMKYQFVMSGDTDQVTFCAVEELVLEHYKTNGYPEGLHAEGSIISNLFIMFFWEELYMTVPDVFQGPFQTAPLDLYTQDFYNNRKETIDERLEWLQRGTEEELVATVGEIWEKHNGEMCQGINWEKFSGPETLQGLVRCMGGLVIAGMLDRFVKNPRHTRSGFPDLTLWNTETKALKICEVKGPNDRLSYKQILWIDHLLKLGVDAEVCYVKAVGSKRLKSSSSKH